MFERVYGLKPHLRLERDTPGGEAFLLGEREHFAVGGHMLDLLERLDGDKSLEALVRECPHLARGQVLHTIMQLEAGGVIEPVREGPPEHAAFEAGMSWAKAAGEHVRVVGTSAIDGACMSVMQAALADVGLSVVESSDTKTVVVVLTTDYLDPGCVAAARQARAAGQPCFLVQATGLRPLIGPYLAVGPRQPCIRCLTHALARQRPVAELLQRGSPSAQWPTPPRAALPTSIGAATNLAAIELRKLLGRGDLDQQPARLWSLDLIDFRLTAHVVCQRPQCPECGDATLMAQRGTQPIEITSVAIGDRLDGGFRRESPAHTHARLQHLVSPLLGPVTHLGPMPGRHTETRPVFTSGYFVCPRVASEHRGFDRNCAGKGRTIEQARISALAEAIERISGSYQGDEAVVHASFAALGHQALQPAELQLFGHAQPDRPPSLPSEAEIAWTPAWSLTHACRRYLPLAYCYSNAPSETGSQYCRPSSNGSAAGSCLVEAILQGLFELIERDAAALWWYTRARRPAMVIPPAIAAYVDSMRIEYELAGWYVWLLDLTHDLGVPVVTAVATRASDDRFALGFGCHPEPTLAISRALTELNQVFDPRGLASSPWDGMPASQLDYLHPDPRASARAPAPPVVSDDLRDHLLAWVDRLQQLGLETIVVDKTRPDFELCVAQVVVPGLRHVWPRLGPGRLYRVPVELGWIAAPLDEDQLNPRPLLV